MSSSCATATPGVRRIANDRLAPGGIELRRVPTDTDAIVAASDGRAAGLGRDPVEPRAPRRRHGRSGDVMDAAGGRLAVDDAFATPLGQRPLDLGADSAMLQRDRRSPATRTSSSAPLSVRDPEWAAQLRAHRTQGGSIPGPFESWMLHRSLAHPRAAAWSARTPTRSRSRRFMCERPEVLDVRHPGSCRTIRSTRSPRAPDARAYGPLVGSRSTVTPTAPGGFLLAALALVAEATSCSAGGVHLTSRAARALGHRRRGRRLHPLLGRLRRPWPTCRADIAQALERRLRDPPPGGSLRSTPVRRGRGSGGPAPLGMRHPCRARRSCVWKVRSERQGGLCGTDFGETLASGWPRGTVPWRTWKVRGPGWAVRLCGPLSVCARADNDVAGGDPRRARAGSCSRTSWVNRGRTCPRAELIDVLWPEARARPRRRPTRR